MNEAIKLARTNYAEERSLVPALPESVGFPGIIELADNGLGFAAFHRSDLVGYLCCIKPEASPLKMAFSPLQTHGAVKNDRAKIYSLLYQRVAQTLVEKGIISHAIALYAHDAEALNSFFFNGFGMRCMDAVRAIGPIICPPVPDCDFRELPVEEFSKVLV